MAATVSQSTLLSEYMRIAAFSIAGWDYLATMPDEWHMYKRAWAHRKLSLAGWLFVAVRYLSIVALVVNAVGYWGEWSQSACHQFYFVPQSFKMIAGFAAEGIIALRTIAIGGNRLWIKITMVVLMILVLPLQVFGNYWKRLAGQINGNCQARLVPGNFNTAPLYYAGNLFFDVVACVLCVWMIVAQSRGLPIHRFTREVLKHGLLYAAATTLANLLVMLGLFGLPVVNGLGSTLSISITSIMAQRLVLVTQRLILGTSRGSATPTDDTGPSLSKLQARRTNSTNVPFVKSTERHRSTLHYDSHIELGGMNGGNLHVNLADADTDSGSMHILDRKNAGPPSRETTPTLS